MLFGPGFIEKPNEYELASLLLKITFPYILFISLTALCGSILNSIGRFAVPSFTPVLLNVCMISAAILFSAGAVDEIAKALAWGIFVAGIVQLLFQLPFLWREGLLVMPRWGWKSSGVQKILSLMMPALFGVSISQINLLLDTVIASLLDKSGSITWLYYSDRMLEFPLGLFGIAISTVILPILSKQHASKDSGSFDATLNWGLRLVCMMGIPATIGLFIMAEPIILTVFQHGKFTELSAYYTSLSLKAYIIGLLAFMLVKVLATGFFSRQDTKTPVKVGIIAMVVNMVFNLLLFHPLEHVGLALATAISAIVNASLLFIMLRKKSGFKLDSRWLSWLIKLTFANIVLIAFILWFMPEVKVWQDWNSIERIKQMVILVIGSISIYAIALMAFGVRMRDLKFIVDAEKKDLS
jgi:putative peptidoglycan lipid II flippase